VAQPAAVRRQYLARLVATRRFVRVVDAAEDLGVSEVTIRGDLRALEREGEVKRVHGGAMVADGTHEATVEQSRARDAEAKRAIGREAAALVESGQSIFVDVGSTALEFAAALISRDDLNDLVVVTNGLTIALALEPVVPRFTVIVTGGTLRTRQHSLVNPLAATMLDSLQFELAFISCNGIHVDRGVTNVNLPEAEIKSLVLARSRRNILMADAQKLGRTEVAVIGPIADFDELVTAGAVPAALLADLRSHGLVVRVADSLER
jgi:DeoR family transcriptional regulator of aga operon